MADYSKYYEAREVVTRILEQDFIGPVTKDECLAEVPVQYYIMGKLYPQKDTVAVSYTHLTLPTNYPV